MSINDAMLAGALDIADQPQEMADKIVQLLQDPAFARRRGLEGCRRVTAEHNWDESLGRLLEILQDPGGTAASSTLSRSENAG